MITFAVGEACNVKFSGTESIFVVRSGDRARAKCYRGRSAASGSDVVGAIWQPSTQKGDWPYYFADSRGSRYSPQDQINASNFNQLEVAWHFKTGNLGARPEYKLEGTPLEINGTAYTTAGLRRDVIALNARTGELKWVGGNYSGDYLAFSLPSYN